MTHHKKHKAEDEVKETPLEAAKPAQQEQAPAAVPEAEDCASLKAQRDDYLARLQRVSADFINYQKRAQREMADIREHANADLLKGILPIMDDMERALAAAGKTSAADDPLLKGIEMVHAKALETLARYGVKPIAAMGLAFDPTQHQAVMQMPSDKQPPNTVVQELQRGYSLKGRTLRPATVVVSKMPDEEPQAPAEECGCE